MGHDERMYIIDTQKINLTGFNPQGRLLDIGGGGEGVIGQLLGERVVAIDPRGDELEEAAEGPLKIIMDARELKFLDNTFDGATSFFTLMYINKEYHYKVFQEVYRVLKDGGEFIVWDARIPEYPGGIKDIFLVPLEIQMEGKNITPTYGVSWKGTEQDLLYYTQIGETLGFEAVSIEALGEVYCLKFKKVR